jgi:hypothetical protein
MRLRQDRVEIPVQLTPGERVGADVARAVDAALDHGRRIERRARRAKDAAAARATGLLSRARDLLACLW